MGIMKDILLDLKGVFSGSNSSIMDDIGSTLNRTKAYNSLSKKAKEGILQFPVITTKSLDMETTSLVSKALERQYSSFVQVVLSMNSTALMDDGKGVADFIKKFHQNADNNTANLNSLPNTVKEAFDYDTEQYEGFQIQSLLLESSTGKIVAEHKYKLASVMESFREDKLNDKFIPTEPGVSTKIVIKGFNKVLKEADSQSTTHAVALKDTDVKKANELVPTSLQLRLNIQDKTGKIVGTQEFIIGVKCTLHAVSSEEMLANVGNMSRGKMFNFIRWTTGEIEFVKDFLFNIDGIKTSVVNKSKGASPWWITLKKRAALANIKKKTFMSGQILPNATIIMSMEEAESLKYEKGLDIMDVSNANKLMSEFFLLGLVVVDNSAQICHFIFDGRHEYESVSFSGLERENKSGGVNINDVVKLMNKY